MLQRFAHRPRHPHPSRPPPLRRLHADQVMVVIVILGVLAALVVPRIRPVPTGARGRGAPGHRLADAGAQALQARQPALSEHRAGPGRAGRASDRGARARELEGLRGAPARRPLGPALPVPGAGRAGEVDVFSYGADGRPGGEASTPTSALAALSARPLRQRASPCSAASLVELLVVLVIVGIAGGGITLALDRAQADDGEHEVERLRRALEGAAYRARAARPRARGGFPPRRLSLPVSASPTAAGSDWRHRRSSPACLCRRPARGRPPCARGPARGSAGAADSGAIAPRRGRAAAGSRSPPRSRKVGRAEDRLRHAPRPSAGTGR